MKYPLALSDTTPYYEKYFHLTEPSAGVYVSAFREAQHESRLKCRKENIALFTITLGLIVAWALGFVHLIFPLGALGASIAINRWRKHHESELLERTFQLALKDKEPQFRDYMMRYRETTPAY